MAMIGLEEAVGHLRIDLAENDERYADLMSKIEQAEGIILDYLKITSTIWDEKTTPFPVKAAVLLMLGDLWDVRVETDKADYLAENGPIARLLRRFRDPAMA